MSRTLVVTVSIPLPDDYFAEARLSTRLGDAVEELTGRIKEQAGVDAAVKIDTVKPRAKRQPKAAPAAAKPVPAAKIKPAA